VANKPKNVDGIGKPEILTGKTQYKQGDPLLSIIEPETVASSQSPAASKAKKGKKNAAHLLNDEVMPGVETVAVKKQSIWTRPLFQKQNKEDKTHKQKVAKSVKDKSVVPESVVPVTLSGTKGPGLDSSAKPQNDSNVKGEKFLHRHRKAALITGFSLLGIVLLSGLIGGGVYAHQAIYTNKVFPGVVVWGEPVGAKTMTEVQGLISDKIKGYVVTIKGPDQEYKATSTDLGVVFNSESMALSAYSKGRTQSVLENYVTRMRLLASLIDWDPWKKLVQDGDLAIAPSYDINQTQLTAYLTKVADNIKITPQDSQVTITGGTTQLKPAIYGRSVDVDSLKKQVLGSIGSFKSTEIVASTASVKPAIIDNSAQEVMLQAQNVMRRPVVLTFKGVTYQPNQETVASWITFTKATGSTNYTLVIDKSKMSSYFAFLGTKINVYSVPQMVRVENGVKETQTQAGANGILVDTNQLGNTIAAQLPVQSSVNLVIPTYVDVFKTKYEQVIVADWDKYIDVNLSTQTMMACEKGGVNCHSWKVTTGNDTHSTPTGVSLISGKSSNFYMTGGTPGVDYYKVYVNWAIWFRPGGYAIHDASWRNGSFGGQDYHWNGSHGCVNSPNEAASYIFNWADVGTPVTVHY